MAMQRALLGLMIFYGSSFLNVFAQSIDYGVEAGANGTLVAVNSSYALGGDAINKNPSIGYYGGAYAVYHYSAKTSVKARLLYEKRVVTNADKAPFTNEIGQLVGEVEGAKTRNHYLNLGIFYQRNLSKKLVVGIGINTHVQLSASTFLYGSNDFGEPKGVYSNYSCKTLNFSIPVQATLHLHRINLFLTLDKGVFSRVKDRRSDVKETENALQLGLGYPLNKPLN